jgi:hypothetical protein
MPYTVAETDAAALDTTTRFNPAFSTNPVLSNTPLPAIIVSYSRYSAIPGELAVNVNATLTVTEFTVVFVKERLHTVYDPVGTVYTVVFVPNAVPTTIGVSNLPVAIFFSVYRCIKNASATGAPVIPPVKFILDVMLMPAPVVVLIEFPAMYIIPDVSVFTFNEL